MAIHRRPRRRHGRSSKPRDALKDRLIQTRVPGDLESALKEEARKRRLSVSHLIRNVLEDTFHLVDNVVAEVDNLVQDSVGLARQVSRDAGRIANTARSAADRGRPHDDADEDEDEHEGDEEEATQSSPQTSPKADKADKPEPAVDPLAHVLAWNKVVMNAAGRCAKCGKALSRGDEAHLGLSASAGAPPTFLCAVCITKLGA